MEHLLREENLSLPDWLEVQLPVKQKLFKPLQDVFRTDVNPDSTAVLAAEAISRLASDKADAQVLCEMLAEATKDQYRPLFDALEMSGNREEIGFIAKLSARMMSMAAWLSLVPKVLRQLVS